MFSKKMRYFSQILKPQAMAKVVPLSTAVEYFKITGDKYWQHVAGIATADGENRKARRAERFKSRPAVKADA